MTTRIVLNNHTAQTAIMRSCVFHGDTAGKITVQEHFDRFFVFDTTDVWTSDGWLIASCFESDRGISHQMRKGYQVQQAILPADEVLFYQPNQVTKRHGF
mgnify:FL=1